MTRERWHKIEACFHTTLARPSAERAAFLADTCAGDEDLRREVAALLAADDEFHEADTGWNKIARDVAASWYLHEEGYSDLIGQTVGRYEVLAPLGRGGMGEVFLARDTTLGRQVALKLLPSQHARQPERLRRFEREARATSALNHPNILTIHEIGEWNGAPFIAMEFVEGETLLARAGMRPLSEVLDIGIQASGAIAAAHDAGIVHRDIKPSNLMRRADGWVKVLDFGVAKLIGPRAPNDVTEAGGVRGTVNYMSPEQALGEEVDHRSDLFSLAIVLYQLATGQHPFAGRSEAAVYDAILNRAPPWREVAPALPTEFERVLRRALDKDPARRHPSAVELRGDLQRLAALPGLSHRRARTTRKWRLAGLAAAVAVLFSAVTLVVNLRGSRATGSSMTAAATTPPVVTPTVAVLPFLKLDGEPVDFDFAGGVPDLVRDALGQLRELKVIGRASVLPYRADQTRDLAQIGQQLGANYLIEGSVQATRGIVRVGARLMEASSGRQMWAGSFDRQAPNFFALQGEVARAIAGHLLADLTPEQRIHLERTPTNDLVAFDLYTRAMRILDNTGVEASDETLRDAVALLDRAVERDRQFVVAYRALAFAHDMIYQLGFEHTPGRLASGQQALDAAVALAPGAGETHVSIAWHLYVRQEYERARQELAAARLTLTNPASADDLSGCIDRRQGRWSESTRDFERALDLDPRNPDLLEQLEVDYSVLHLDAAQAGIIERILTLEPGRVQPRIARAEMPLGARGETRPLHQLLETLLREDPADAQLLQEHWLTLMFYERDFPGVAAALRTLGNRRYGGDTAQYSRDFGEGLLARMRGDLEAARAAFTRDRAAQERLVAAQPNYGPPLAVLGLIDAGLGRKEEALAEGRHAVELTPPSRDALNGPGMVTNLAAIAAWVGENDLAIAELHKVADAPPGTRYGVLALDPVWDPLRGDERFRQILANLRRIDGGE